MGGGKNNAGCAMNQIQLKAIEAISQSYLHNFKPLLQVLKVRMKGKYPQNCLNEIRAINDHIARCYRDNMSDEDITTELRKAEGHLQRLAYDCYKQLIVYQTADIKHTVKWFYSSRWPRIGKGELWNTYLDNYKFARKNEKDAKRSESINSDEALRLYDLSYYQYQTILEVFKKYKWQIYLSAIVRLLERITKGIYWLIVTIILSIIATILAWFDII
jgi:hypothetical protein